MIVIAAIGAFATVAGVGVQICKNINVTVHNPAQMTREQATASLSAQFRDFGTFLDRIPDAIGDSIEAGVNRAGRRGFTDQRGTVVGREVLSGILPLGRSVADRWAGVENEVRKTIANMGLADTLLAAVPPLRDLHPTHMQLSSKKDSILEAIMALEKKYSP
jgi:hypothetical protein